MPLLGIVLVGVLVGAIGYVLVLKVRDALPASAGGFDDEGADEDDDGDWEGARGTHSRDEDEDEDDDGGAMGSHKRGDTDDSGSLSEKEIRADCASRGGGRACSSCMSKKGFIWIPDKGASLWGLLAASCLGNKHKCSYTTSGCWIHEDDWSGG